jgi:cell division protein FtsB
VVPIILALLGSGAVVAFFRARPEGSKIIVDAAQGAVIVQGNVMADLRKQLDDSAQEIRELRSIAREVDDLRGHVRRLEHDNEVLAARNDKLESRIKQLENYREGML